MADELSRAQQAADDCEDRSSERDAADVVKQDLDKDAAEILKYQGTLASSWSDHQDHQDHLPLAKRIGRRGASLIILGVVYLTAGLPLLFTEAHIEIHIYELRVWASAFVIAGAVAFVSAFRRHARHDKAGFVALSVVGMLWIIYSVFSTILHFFDPVLFPVLISQLFTTGPILALVAVCAGWDEPIEPVDLAHVRFTPEDDGGRS